MDAGLKPIEVQDKSHFYESKQVLPALYGAGRTDNDIDLTREQAELTRERKIKLARENEIETGRVAPVEVLTDALVNVLKQQVAIFNSLPNEVKHACPAINAREIEIIKRSVAKTRNLAADVTLSKEFYTKHPK